MRSVLSDSDIQAAFNELEATVGVAPDAPWGRIKEMLGVDVAKGLALIAEHMGLPIVVRLKILPKGYRADAKDGFRSEALVRSEGGGGNAGIAAQVTIPGGLPLYGSSAMKGYPIDVVIGEESTADLAAFTTVMAHEFAHVVLYGMRHPKKEDEFYTDLTSMMLGFSVVVKSGRRIVKESTTRSGNIVTTHTQTTTYGYLSDMNFEYAYPRVRVAVENLRLLQLKSRKLVAGFEHIAANSEHAMEDFDAYLMGFEKRPPLRMSPIDAARVVLCHQADYLTPFRKICERHRSHARSFEAEIPVQWYSSSPQWMSLFGRKIYEAGVKAQGELAALHADVAILARYSALTLRLRLLIRGMICRLRRMF
jgi:hypothetical protein